MGRRISKEKVWRTRNIGESTRVVRAMELESDGQLFSRAREMIRLELESDDSLDDSGCSFLVEENANYFRLLTKLFATERHVDPRLISSRTAVPARRQIPGMYTGG
jgi:hypothetical protein